MTVDFQPAKPGEEAGLALRMNTITITNSASSDGGQRVV
jgi:hypothetical protein